MFFKKYSWPLGIVTAMLLFMGMTLLFVRKAFSERVDLVAPDYYYRDKEFSTRLAKEKNLATKGALGISKDGHGVRISLPAYFAGKKVQGKILFYSPLNPAHDFSLPLNGEGRSLYVAAELIAGQVWQVSLDFSSAGETFFAQQNLAP